MRRVAWENPSTCGSHCLSHDSHSTRRAPLPACPLPAGQKHDCYRAVAPLEGSRPRNEVLPSKGSVWESLPRRLGRSWAAGVSREALAHGEGRGRHRDPRIAPFEPVHHSTRSGVFIVITIKSITSSLDSKACSSRRSCGASRCPGAPPQPPLGAEEPPRGRVSTPEGGEERGEAAGRAPRRGYWPPGAARPGSPPLKTWGLSASSGARALRVSLKRPECDTRRLRRAPPPAPAPGGSPLPKGGVAPSRGPGAAGGGGGEGAAAASLCFFLPPVSDFHQCPAELPPLAAGAAAVAAALSAISALPLLRERCARPRGSAAAPPAARS